MGPGVALGVFPSSVISVVKHNCLPWFSKCMTEWMSQITDEFSIHGHNRHMNRYEKSESLLLIRLQLCVSS